MSDKGRDYEHKLARIVGESTNGELIPLSSGYNADGSRDVDLLIDDGEAVHVFELKRTSQDAYTLYWDEDTVQNDDLYGLCRFAREYPRPTYPYAGVRFNRNALAITKLYINDYPDQEQLLDNAVTMSPTETVHTGHGNLRFKEPTQDEWPRTDLDEHDAQHILDAIGYSL